MKLHTAIDLFLGQYQPLTRRTYYYCLNPMMDDIGPNRLITEVNHIDLIRYTNQVKNNGDYTDRTKRKHIGAIKTFFNWLVSMEIIPTAPSSKIKNVTCDEYIGRDKAMPEDDLKKLLKFLDRNPDYHIRHKALVLFLSDTGCRAGGAAGLQWSNVDFTTGTAIVTEKGNRTRPAWFFGLTTLALKDWREAQDRTQGDYVFSHRGGPIASPSLSQVFRRVCIKAGITSHGTHKMRHRKAHQMIDNGESTTDAAIAIGDTVETFIRHYAPKDFASAKEAAKRAATRAAQSKIVQIKRENTGTE